MTELTKEWLLRTIADLEEERDAVPGVVNEDAAMALAAMKLALASLEADSKLSDFVASQESLGVEFEGVLTENIEELYVPSKSTPPAPVSDSLLSELLAIAKKAADAADECAHAEWSDDSMEHSTAIADWERRAAMLQGAENAESPTTMQTSPSLDSSQIIAESPTGINQCKSEPVTTAYKLPFEQWLSQQTGTIDVECGCVMTEVFFHWLRVAYEAGNTPMIPDGWVACSERMPGIGTEIFYFCQDDGLRDCGIVSSSNFSGKGDAELYVHAEGYDLRFGVDITHWMPLPAAPQLK